MKSFKEYIAEAYDGEEVSMNVIRWVSQTTHNAVIQSDLAVFPESEIYSSESLIRDPIEYPDIPIEVIANVSYEKPDRINPGGWFKDEVRDARVSEDVPLYDRAGNPIAGKFLYKDGTPIEISDTEESDAVDVAIQQLKS